MSYPILYESNETVFGHMGIGVLKDASLMTVDEERNGLFTAKLKYPIFSEMFSELKPDRIVKADANPNLKDQRFRIVRLSKPAKGMVTVDLQHVSHETEGMQLKPKVEYSGTGHQALNTWSNNIVDDHEFTVYSDITHFEASGVWTVDQVESARRALGGVRGSILDSYGGEYLFDNYHISLLRNRGNDNGVFIAYGKNLTDLEQEEEIANTYTSVYPYAIVRDEENDTEELITLPEYYIDSEHIGNFAKRKILTVDFSEDEIDNVEDLRIRTERYITANSVGVPNVNLKVSFVDLAKTLDYEHLKLVENIDLCDIVSIYFPDLDINTSAKVIKVSWNVLLDRYEEIQLGKPRANLSQRIEETVENKLIPVRNHIELVQIGTDGKNKVSRSSDEPIANRVNDIWFEEVDNGSTRIRVWDGIQWVIEVDTEDILKNTLEIEAVNEQVETNIQKLELLEQRIEELESK